MLDYIGIAFLLLASVAFFISSFGLIRMPDVYTRIHVGTKASTIGTILIIIGACFLEPSWSFKLLLLGAFILLTNPLSSSVIARATHNSKKES